MLNLLITTLINLLFLTATSFLSYVIRKKYSPSSQYQFLRKNQRFLRWIGVFLTPFPFQEPSASLFLVYFGILYFQAFCLSKMYEDSNESWGVFWRENGNVFKFCFSSAAPFAAILYFGMYLLGLGSLFNVFASFFQAVFFTIAIWIILGGPGRFWKWLKKKLPKREPLPQT